jgi:hypothetical protein
MAKTKACRAGAKRASAAGKRHTHKSGRAPRRGRKCASRRRRRSSTKRRKRRHGGGDDDNKVEQTQLTAPTAESKPEPQVSTPEAEKPTVAPSASTEPQTSIIPDNLKGVFECSKLILELFKEQDDIYSEIRYSLEYKLGKDKLGLLSNIHMGIDSGLKQLIQKVKRIEYLDINRTNPGFTKTDEKGLTDMDRTISYLQTNGDNNLHTISNQITEMATMFKTFIETSGLNLPNKERTVVVEDVNNIIDIVKKNSQLNVYFPDNKFIDTLNSILALDSVKPLNAVGSVTNAVKSAFGF